MTDTEQLIEQSGCAVVFEIMDEVYGGRYLSDINNILINSVESESGQLANLAHEASHAICDAKKCKCRDSGQEILSEYHAYKFSLSWLLNHRCKEAMRYNCDLIEQVTTFSNHPVHRQAAKRVVKLKLWAKCVAYVNEGCSCDRDCGARHKTKRKVKGAGYKT